jgi:plastocyanin
MGMRLGLVVALVLVAGACDDDETDIDEVFPADASLTDMVDHRGFDAGTTSDGPQATVVEIVASGGDRFLPATVTIPAGSTVRFRNGDNEDHTSTSGASSQSTDNPGALFDQVMRPGDSFEFTFPSAGTFPFFCRFHEGEGMKGTITVE